MNIYIRSKKTEGKADLYTLIRCGSKPTHFNLLMQVDIKKWIECSKTERKKANYLESMNYSHKIQEIENGIKALRKHHKLTKEEVDKLIENTVLQEVREKRGLSYDISSRMQFFTDAGMFTVTAGVDPSKEALAVKTIEKEIDRIRSKKVPASELKRIKEFMLGNFRLSHERVVSKLFFYGSTLLSYGRLMTTEEQVEAVKAVTAADVLEVAEAIFDPANRSCSRVVPKKPHSD